MKGAVDSSVDLDKVGLIESENEEVQISAIAFDEKNVVALQVGNVDSYTVEKVQQGIKDGVKGALSLTIIFVKS